MAQTEDAHMVLYFVGLECDSQDEWPGMNNEPVLQSE